MSIDGNSLPLISFVAAVSVWSFTAWHRDVLRILIAVASPLHRFRATSRCLSRNRPWRSRWTAFHWLAGVILEPAQSQARFRDIQNREVFTDRRAAHDLAAVRQPPAVCGDGVSLQRAGTRPPAHHHAGI